MTNIHQQILVNQVYESEMKAELLEEQVTRLKSALKWFLDELPNCHMRHEYPERWAEAVSLVERKQDD